MSSSRAPDVRDGLVVLGGSVFTLAGLALARQEPGLGLFTASFFGLCASVGAWSWRQRYKARATLARADEVVGFAAGARLVASPVRPTLAGLVVFGTGVSFAALFPGTVPLAVGTLAALLGAAALASVALGRYRSVIELRPEGLRFEDASGSYLVPWDGLQVALVELHSHPVILLAPARPDLVRAGGSVSLFPGNFGLDAGATIKALARYAAVPAAREELRERPVLPG